MKRTLQPRYTDHLRIGDGGTVDAEPLQIGRRPVPAMKEQPRAVVGSTGVRAMARRERHAEEIGEPLGTTPCWLAWQRPAWTKEISRREGPRVSDEAIVSMDLGGQHNLPASQGPLDWIGSVGGKGCRLDMSPTTVNSPCPRPCLWARISTEVVTPERRSHPNSSLKPYWGKPTVRNFRGGAGNVVASHACARLLSTRRRYPAENPSIPISQ